MPDVSHLPDAVFESKSLSAFNRVFITLPEVRAYAALLIAAAGVAAWLAEDFWNIALPVGGIFIGYPAFEYVLHRWLLHNTYLCRTAMTARVWWRIHYRHHADPRDASVILGAPWTLIVAVGTGALLATSLYWSLEGLAAAVAAALFCALAYEWFHSLEHSRVELTNPYLLRMRRNHLAHHYFSEQGNYGIATDVIDRLMRTVLLPERNQRSPTVYNLGYQGEMQQRYPYVEKIERAHGHTPPPDPGSARGSASP